MVGVFHIGVCVLSLNSKKQTPIFKRGSLIFKMADFHIKKSNVYFDIKRQRKNFRQ